MSNARRDQEQQEGGVAEQLRKRREELLDEALEETFPASDPPSIARPNIGKAKS